MQIIIRDPVPATERDLLFLGLYIIIICRAARFYVPWSLGHRPVMRPAIFLSFLSFLFFP